ncbi:serine hydrolase domain-containing protein [Serinibacter arcticus]|nr:serine hydrolase domain-containing protein [Serinibacter arcticus]
MPDVIGDLDLIGTARGWGIGDCVLGVVDPDGVRVAGVGVDPAQHVELGSVSKGLTGLLYEDALERGEVERTTALGDALPALAGTAAGAIPLDALATHRSGLPRLPAGMHPWRRSWDLLRHGRNPYGESLAQVLRQAARTGVAGRPKPLYSNLGFALLGHAVAARSGVEYAALLESRLAVPLGADSLHVPDTRGEIRPGAMVGTTGRGRSREPWVGEGIGPAGGVRATITDAARLVQALLDGDAPGLSALRPRADFVGAYRIGSVWVTSSPGGGERRITWHNGGTGGFRSFVGLDREAGRGIVVVSPRSVAPDRRATEWLLGRS